MSADVWQFEKMRSAEAYYQNLQVANQKSTQQFQEIINRSYLAFNISMVLHGITYILAIVALGAGLINLLSQKSGNQPWAAASIFVGIMILIILIRRDPLRNTHVLINNLARFSVVFAGYMRQLHQVDTTFHEIFLSKKEYSIDDMEEMLGRIQLIVENALDSMNQIVEDFEIKTY
jgi:hypothetical protein